MSVLQADLIPGRHILRGIGGLLLISPQWPISRDGAHASLTVWPTYRAGRGCICWAISKRKGSGSRKVNDEGVSRTRATACWPLSDQLGDVNESPLALGTYWYHPSEGRRVCLVSFLWIGRWIGGMAFSWLLCMFHAVANKILLACPLIQ